MVGTIHPPAATADAATRTFVQARLAGQTYRFLTADHRGLAVHLDDLADVITEIITDYTDHLMAERDALAEDLAHELNARGGNHNTDDTTNDTTDDAGRAA